MSCFKLVVVFFDAVILSGKGVQQGDPEGPHIFSEGVISEMNEWYLDDGYIAAEADLVLINFKRLIVGHANMGLKINTSKCELVFLKIQ